MTNRGRWLIAGIALAGLLALGLRIGSVGDGPREVADVAPLPDAGGVPNEGETPSPFATSDGAGDGSSGRNAAAPTRPDDDLPGVAGTDEPPLDLRTLGRTDLSDEAFEALVARLSRDPALLRSLIDEFRSETDPERLGRLARLLGDVDDPSVVLLATELVYSGDEASRLLGLDLLKRVRPGDPDVRDVVSGLLSSESDGRILVGTLTAMARPGAADADTRAGLAGQVSLLTGHVDPGVRRTSLDILSRWSDAPEHTALLLAGLDDDDRAVRRTAAYAMVGREDADGNAKRTLFAVAGNDSEDERTRRGAILALKGMPLEPGDRERLLEIERRLDLRPR